MDRPAAEKWRKWINKIVSDVGFADDPTYENNWMRSCKSGSKNANKRGVRKKKRRKKKKKDKGAKMRKKKGTV